MVIVKNGSGQNLPGLEACLFVPAGIKRQLEIERFELRLVIGVTDIDDIVRIGHIACDALVADRNANFLDLRAGQKHGINFVVQLVHNINGDGGGMKKLQNPVFYFNKNMGDIVSGMDAVGYFLQTFPDPQFFIHAV